MQHKNIDIEITIGRVSYYRLFLFE
ncbi:hypothetical protein L195_g060178, partial [Trifolium pratense]